MSQYVYETGRACIVALQCLLVLCATCIGIREYNFVLLHLLELINFLLLKDRASLQKLKIMEKVGHIILFFSLFPI